MKRKTELMNLLGRISVAWLCAVVLAITGLRTEQRGHQFAGCLQSKFQLLRSVRQSSDGLYRFAELDAGSVVPEHQDSQVASGITRNR